MTPGDATAEQRLERIATRSHGVVTHHEAVQAGISADQIKHRRKIGLLLPTRYRGVYRFGHRAPGTGADYLAAVKACGPGPAELYGMAAAYWLSLLKGKSPPPPEVTAPANKNIPGLRTHWNRRGPAPLTTIWKGIPVTTPAQTIVDLAARLTEEELAVICHEAGFRHRTTPAQVKRVLERRPKAPGVAKLRRVLGWQTPVSLSYLERRFIALLRSEGLPLPPETNRSTDGRRLDCRWPRFRLTVELDSYTFHNSRHSWERDRQREREAYARGDEFRRYSYGDVTGDTGPMLGELRPLLSS